MKFVDHADARIRRAQLVTPDEVQRNHCISVLSPIGSALIGLRPEQSIRWTEQGREEASLFLKYARPGLIKRFEEKRALTRRLVEVAKEHDNPTAGLEHDASIFYNWALDPHRR